MAKSKKENKKSSILVTLATVLFLVLIAILQDKGLIDLSFLKKDKNIIATISAEKVENASAESQGNIVKIYFFDVGEADCILLTNDNKTMLIDAGNNGDGNKIVNNIKNLGITRLDYVVGTHAHSDHIGGIDTVIKAFDIGTIYMPKIQTNTKTFEEVLDEIEAKKLKITSPKVGTKFNVGNVECEIMLAGTGTEEEQEENLNLSSIVIRAVYKEQSFLFMADAEEINENSRSWPQTTVLKVGHHGSNTSSSLDFLNQVKPQIAIIQVGKNNDYWHPHQVTLKKLNKIGATIYRTDKNGTITITCNGKKNVITTEK